MGPRKPYPSRYRAVVRLAALLPALFTTAAVSTAQKNVGTAIATTTSLSTPSVPSDHAARGSPAARGWGNVTDVLFHASLPDLHLFLEPFGAATTLTYTATWGSYYNPTAVNATLPGGGWTKGAEVADPPEGGMRAMYFVHVASSRGLIAFRGSDLNETSRSGQADACADVLLWAGGRGLPGYCREFSPHTLDYLGRAREYAALVRRAWPGIQWCVTGHSLGAGLAAIIAASTSERRSAEGMQARVGLPSLDAGHVPSMSAIVFSPPPGVRRWLAVEGYSESAVTLADEWDPLYHEARAGGGVIGPLCLWSSSETAACEACWHSRPFNQSSRLCQECFMERHIWRHYLKVDIPGPRPVCYREAPTAREGSSECSGNRSTWRRVECILTYGGSISDMAINYSVLLLCLGAAWTALSTPQTSQEWERAMWQLAALGSVFAFQIGLCVMVGCSGISIVWNAVIAFVAVELRLPIPPREIEWYGTMKHWQVAVIVSAMVAAAAADAYYAVTADAITSVAHACALALGLVIAKTYLWWFRSLRNAHRSVCFEKEEMESQDGEGGVGPGEGRDDVDLIRHHHLERK